MSNRSLYLRLLGYVKPYRRMFALAILAMVVTAGAEALMPVLLKPLLDGGFVEKDQSIIQWMPILLVGLAVVRGAATFVSQVGLTWVATRVVVDLRREMFARLLGLPTARYDSVSSGVLLSKVTYDVNRVMLASTDALIVLVRDSLTIVGLLAWMFYVDWQLTLLVFMVVPLISLVIKKISRHLRHANQSMQEAMGDMSRILEESIRGHKLVKIFSGQDYEARRFHGASDAVRYHEVRAKAASHTSIFIVQVLIALVLAVIVFIATNQNDADALSVGGFISLFTAMGMLFAPIKRLTKVNEQLQQGLAAAQSVFDLIDESTETDAGRQCVQRLRGEVGFHGIHFAYPGEVAEPVLHGIQLDIRAGETVALVGASGSGKSTLANLLARFYELPRGQLTIDGIDINELPLADLRANIALVSQDVVLFNDTVAANIAYGSMSGASREAIRAAAQQAHALEFIEQMSDGLDTVIGERGVKLSGGQRQRLAIARALLKDAPLLIFDEATSALDSRTEKQVQASLETLKQGRTTLLIAHRLSTIENADRIVVMERGAIVETGTHQELIMHNGVYARLYQVQQNRA